jgi:hypothetical protein
MQQKIRMRRKLFIKIIFIFLIQSFIVCNAQQKDRKGFAISVNSKIDSLLLTKNEFKNATFGIHSFYPEFEGKLKLKKFKVKYPGRKEIEIDGSKLNEKAIRELQSLKIGDKIIVYDAVSQNNHVEIFGLMIITIR